MKEELTDGNTGMDNAEKAKKGSYEKPIDGYSDKSNGRTSSLLNDNKKIKE